MVGENPENSCSGADFLIVHLISVLPYHFGGQNISDHLDQFKILLHIFR